MRGYQLSHETAGQLLDADPVLREISRFSLLILSQLLQSYFLKLKLEFFGSNVGSQNLERGTAGQPPRALRVSPVSMGVVAPGKFDPLSFRLTTKVFWAKPGSQSLERGEASQLLDADLVLREILRF